MDHSPLRKKSRSARECLAEGVREGTERVHCLQQDRFARSRKALRRGAGGTGRRVLPWRGRSSRHPSESWDLARSRETMAIPAFAGMTDMGHLAVSRSVVITAGILLAERARRSSRTTGKPCDAASIGNAIATRAIMEDLRAGMEGVGGGAPPFSKADRSNFLQALVKIGRG